jgi:hypothetical protein
MIQQIDRTFRDWRWWMRARFARGISLDRMRMVDDDGVPCEVVHPRVWDVVRWWAWMFRAPGRAEIVLHDRGGVAVFLKLRTRAVPPPRPLPIYLTVDLGRGFERRPIVPGPVPAASLLSPEDPGHRLVPDEVLLRGGVTHRE